MLILLLGSTLAFVAGTALTRDKLLGQQVASDTERVIDALQVRVQQLGESSEMLVNDPQVIVAIRAGGENALSVLNARAVAVRDRLALDLVQIYDQEGRARTNLVTSSLYRESSLLDWVETGGQPAVRVAAGRVLLLSQADMQDGLGTVVVGLDLEQELQDIVSQYRLFADLGLSVAGANVSTRENLLFGGTDQPEEGQYIRHHELTLGETPADLLLVRSTSDIDQVINTGLGVMIGSTLLATLLLIALSVLTARSIARPIQHLSATVDVVAKGNLDQQVEVAALAGPFGIGDDDEIGLLAVAFNSMVAELRGLYQNLEAKVQARTRELSTAAAVARAVSSSLELDVVLDKSVHVIQEQLVLNHVGLFLLQADTGKAVLHAGTGEVGRWLKEQSFKLTIGSDSMVAQVVATGRPLIVEDAMAAPTRLFPEPESAAVIPLLAGDKVIGVLYVQSAQQNAMTPELQNLLVTLADQIAIGVENARLYASEQRRRHLTELLELTGRALSSRLDLYEVPERILSLLNTLVPYERGSLWLKEGQIFRPITCYGFPDGQLARQIELEICEGDVFQQVAELRQPVIVDDVTHEPGWTQLPWLPLHHSWLGAPILCKGELIGMVSLTRPSIGAFKPEDADLVQTFATQAGIALENAQLYAEITRFNEQLEQLVQERTEELNTAYELLERLDRTKADFIKVAAHELRTPLTVIKMSAQMLQSFLASEANAGVKSSLEGVLSGAKRLHTIVNSMLDVAKIDNQTLQMSQEDVSLKDVIGRLCENLKEPLAERRLNLTVEGFDELPLTRADPDLLYKVFFHLVCNAIKYTPDGGQIGIQGRVCTLEGQASHVEIVVSDTGIGIDSRHHELIFEKFYRTGEVILHSSGTHKFKGGGPGLGLAIVRGIVQAHGGKIWVESEGCDEKRCPGSCFYVQLAILHTVMSDMTGICQSRENKP